MRHADSEMHALLLACLACATPKAGRVTSRKMLLACKRTRWGGGRAKRSSFQARGRPVTVRGEEKEKNGGKKERKRGSDSSWGVGQSAKVDRVTHKNDRALDAHHEIAYNNGVQHKHDF